MNRKSKKRLSILKKAGSSEEASPTFTKTTRRISFSGKKSIKEFTSDDHKMTIWGKSYEVSAEIAQSALHQTTVTDSTICQSTGSTSICSTSQSQIIDKENDIVHLRNRKVLKRKSNVLKALRVQPKNRQMDSAPITEAVAMDISINENDTKSQQQISVGEFLSPKKKLCDKSIVLDNLTPVPPHKMSKYNEPDNRLTDELLSDSCVATSDEGSSFSYPSRILNKGDINLTYGYNISEFDLLTPRRRPSENVTSFATKIDRINFSNEDDVEPNDVNAVMLKIQNPKIEQMRLTGTIITATDQNLDISIEISDGSKVLDSLQTDAAEAKINENRNAQTRRGTIYFQNHELVDSIVQSEPAINTENSNHQQDKKRETIHFANSDLELSIFESSTGEINNIKDIKTFSNESSIHFEPEKRTLNLESTILPNCELEMTLINSNQELQTSKIVESGSQTINTVASKVRGTIHFQDQQLDLSTAGYDNLDDTHKIHENQGLEASTLKANRNFNKQTKRGTIFSDCELEMSMIESNTIVKDHGGQKQQLEMSTAESYPIVMSEIRKVKSTRDTMHFLNQELETSLVIESRTQPINIVAPKVRGTIIFPNHELDLTTAVDDNLGATKEFRERGEMSTLNTNRNLNKCTKRETILPNCDLDLSITESDPIVEGHDEAPAKRPTIHFPNDELETSTIMAPETVGMNTMTSKTATNRGTIHFSNQHLEMSTIQSSRNETSKIRKEQTTRGTIHFPNQQLETSMVMEPVIKPINVESEVHVSHEPQTKRSTMHFPDQQLDMSTAVYDNLSETRKSHQDRKDIEISTINVNRNLNTPTKRETIFPNCELDISITESDSIVEGHEAQPKRGTIHFPNHEIESTTIMSPETERMNTIASKTATNRVTRLFSNQHLDMSTVQSNRNETSKICKQQTTRGTIYFPNQELESSMVLEPVTKPINVESEVHVSQETQIKRDTMHFPDQQIDMSTAVYDSLSETRKSHQDRKDIEISTINANRNIKSTKRETIFPNCDLDISITESDSIVEDHEAPGLRATINFPDQELGTSVVIEPVIVKTNTMTSKTATNRGTIHFSNQHLEMSTIQSSRNETSKIHKKQSTRGTIRFPNQELENSIVKPINVESEVHVSHETHTKRSTMHFPDQQLDMSTAVYDNLSETKKSHEDRRDISTLNVNRNLTTSTKRETIFPNCELDISITESDPIVEEHETQPKRVTIHFPNHELESTTIMAPETVGMNTMASKTATNRGTIHFTNQHRKMSSVQSSRNETSKIPKQRSTRGTIHFSDQELESSMVMELVTKPINVESEVHVSHATQIKRSTMHFPDQQLDMSTAVYDNFSETRKSHEDRKDIEIPTLNANRNLTSTKRETIFPNCELDISITESDTIVEGHEAPAKRGTIHFPNHELESTTIFSPETERMNTVASKSATNRGTRHFSNQHLDMSTVQSNRNETSKICKQQATRGTIHFPNQELENSMVKPINVESAVPHEVSHETQTKRSTMHFPDQQLDMSTAVYDNLSETRKSHEDRRDIEISTLKANRKLNMPTKRETIFPNCELDMSITETDPVVEEHEAQPKRATINFPNQKLETSMVIEPVTVKTNTLTSKTATNRGTIHFPNQQVETSMIMNVTPAVRAAPETQTKRATIHFPNQELDTSGVIEHAKTKLMTKRNTIRTLKKDFEMSMPKNLDIQDRELPNNPATKHSALDKSTSVAKPMASIKPQSANCRTMYFQNDELDLSFEEENHIELNKFNRQTVHYGNEDDLDVSMPELEQENAPRNLEATLPKNLKSCSKIELSVHEVRELGKNRPQPLEPGTIYYVDKTLDLSEFEPKNRNTVYLVDDDTVEIESNIQYKKQPTRSTIYYPNEAGQMDTNISKDDNSYDDVPEIKNVRKYRETVNFVGTGLDGLDISDEEVPIDSVAQSIKRETKPARSRLEELEQKIWGYPKSSANTNCREPARASRIPPIINLDETGKTNADDLNMTNNFDEKHIKQQSTMSNLAHIVQYLNEKGKDGDGHEKSGSINLNDKEMEVCSYYEPDEKLAHDLSGLKILGQDSKDSMYFENNTHVLCNLDPKRIFCVSDPMDAAVHSHLESIALTPKRSIIPDSSNKLIGSPGRPNISTYQLQDENTLQDTIPRFANDSIPNNIPDFLELTANLPHQSKTREEICKDYINLTISRFSSSVANSSNLENDLIDQTSIQLVDSLLDLEEEPKPLENNLKYVRIEDVDEVYQNVDKMLSRKKTTHVPVLDLTKYQELLNQPSFADIANEYKLRNLKNLKRVSDIKEPVAGPEKPSLRFLMNNYREQKMKEYSEKHRKHFGITPFLPLTPKIPVLLQNKLAERSNYWTCHDAQYNHGILMFTHQRVPCIQIKMLFEFLEETEFGELEFTSIIPMMSKTKILTSTFELIQHLQFFKKVPADMKNMCRRSNEILDFLEHLDSKIITKNYEDVQTLSEIVAATNAKIWHQNETGEYGITKSLIYKRNIYDIVINISDLQITDISDVTVKPRLNPTNQVKNLSRGLDFIRQLLQRPRDYFNFYE